MSWLKLFRVVNLPTVPGDVFVGMSAVAAAALKGQTAVAVTPRVVVGVSLASVFLYLFGLVDNDVVGAAADVGRPIPDGAISLRAARVARGLCLLAALVAASLANLPPPWWTVAFALAVACVVYNRTRSCAAMGLCRALNVLCGGAAALAAGRCDVLPAGGIALGGVALVFFLYVAGVTKYSEGESADPAKRLRVGFLVGALVYLQLAALLVSYQVSACAVTRNLLLAGAAMLVLLRLARRFLPEVSAS